MWPDGGAGKALIVFRPLPRNIGECHLRAAIDPGTAILRIGQSAVWVPWINLCIAAILGE